MFHTACKGVEVFHAARGGAGSVPRCLQMSNMFIINIRNMFSLEDMVILVLLESYEFTIPFFMYYLSKVVIKMNYFFVR